MTNTTRKRDRRPHRIAPEKLMERTCRELAEYHGCRLDKISFKGRVGFPDRLLAVPAHPFALVALLEFKRDGRPVESHQRYIHNDLRRYGLLVGVIWTVEQFKETLDELLRLARLPEGSRGVDGQER